MLSPAVLMVVCAVSFGGLFWGAERFVEGAASIAKHYQLPPMIIGMVLVGFATSFPEMLVSLLAALQGAASLSIGNALGSYVANIGLVLGISAMIVPLAVNPIFFRRDLPVLTLGLGLAWFLFSDHMLSRTDGFILLGFLIVFIAWLTWSLLSDQAKHVDETAQPPKLDKRSASIWLVLGFGILYVSAKGLIYSAVHLAHHYGLSEMTIGLTVVAIGTSLPELAASIAGALKGEHDIAVGNVIGSNIFGILGVMAMPGIFAPGKVSGLVLCRDFSMMGLITLVLWATAYGWQRPMCINRLEGALLLSIFCGYLYIVVQIPA